MTRTLELRSIAADTRKLNEGAWFELTADRTNKVIDGVPVPGPTDGPCILVVPFGIAYSRAMEEARRPFLERLREKVETNQDAITITGQALARAVFRGCVNLTIDGQAVVWTEQKAVELMTDQQWVWLRECVERKAGERAPYAAREEEQAKGN